MDWDDLKFLLAIHRTHTFSAAARHLAVDNTTVSRRLNALQHAIGDELFHRHRDATLKLTQLGAAIVTHAERMEREAEAIARVSGEQAGKIIGTVRITSVPIVVNKLLAPALSSLLPDHPELIVELVPDSRNLSLTHREADLAIRLARPSVGGTHVKIRRIGSLAYGVFAAGKIRKRDIKSLAWIAFDEALAHLPQSRWLAGLERSKSIRLSALRVTDGETALEAAANGQGVAVVPIVAGRSDPRLQELDLKEISSPPAREVWLLSHSKQRNIKSIRTAMNWIETIDWSGDRLR